MLIEMNPKVLLRKRVFGVLRSFGQSEDGVVTVEWVALAGAVLIGAIAVGWIVLNSLKGPAGSIGTGITNCETAAAAGGSGNTTNCTP